MKKVAMVAGALCATCSVMALQACSSDDTTTATTKDAAAADGTTQSVDGSSDLPDGTIFGTDSGGDTPDANDGGCPASWTVAPVVDPSIAVPDGGEPVLFHASAIGTQDYTCEQTADAGGVYAWIFVGPEADLHDCHNTLIGHHFASDGGAAAPEWMTVMDNAYVIAAKKAAFTPDGGASSVPWLLLQETATGGVGPITKTQWINRLTTDGGVAPSTVCDSNNVGTTSKVAYTADYFFYGN